MVSIISQRYEHSSNGPYASQYGVRNVRGFTLIELIVVMTIVATLLTLALPRYFAGVDRANEAVLRENLLIMRNALDQFHADTGKYPSSLDDLVTKKYLRSVPIDPFTETTSTWQLLPPPADSGTTGVYDVRSGAKGANHAGKPFSDY